MQDPSRSSLGVRPELALELLHATEAAALASARLLGRGDEDRVHEAAGEAMRKALEDSGLAGTVVLGSRNDPYLSPGTVLTGSQPALEFGVFPVEGAGQVAAGHPNAVSIVVAVEPGGFAQLPAVWYAEKIVAGPAARGAVDLDDSIADNLRRIAFARDARVQDLTVAVLDRPRHQELIAEVAAAGARIMTLEEGDIAGAVMATISGSGIDAAIGVGGLHATLVAACAVRCLGGALQARLWPRNDEERALAGDLTSRVYGVADLSPAAEVAVAITGITGGQLLPGVAFGSGYGESSSLLMSSRHATIRRVTTRHHTVGDPS
jgi:fructose-1,6-bisphosphatase II